MHTMLYHSWRMFILHELNHMHIMYVPILTRSKQMRTELPNYVLQITLQTIMHKLFIYDNKLPLMLQPNNMYILCKWNIFGQW